MKTRDLTDLAEKIVFILMAFMTISSIVLMVLGIVDLPAAAKTQAAVIDEAQEARDGINRTVQVSVTYDVTTKYDPGTDLEETKEFMATRLGTGVIVGETKGKSLVLTARHLCRYELLEPDPDDEDGTAKTVGILVQVAVRKIDGSALLAHLVRMSDGDVDACFLEVDGIAGYVAEVAKSLPQLGVKVISTGAPHTIWGPNVAITTEARYSGVMNLPAAGGASLEVYGGTSAAGASGSPIWYHGQLIGLLVRVAGGNGNPFFGLTLDEIRAEIAKTVSVQPGT